MEMWLWPIQSKYPVKRHKFRFWATYVMTPTAHVVVVYKKDDGEVVADAIDVKFKDRYRIL